MQQKTRDLRDRGRETREREIHAPELEELEPEAMVMGVCVTRV
jgi:hypothetical protein